MVKSVWALASKAWLLLMLKTGTASTPASTSGKLTINFFAIKQSNLPVSAN